LLLICYFEETFIVLADIHSNPEYSRIKGDSNKVLINCISRTNVSRIDGFNGTKAGLFGETDCEGPIKVVETLLDHLQNLKKEPKFVILLGYE
jgi:hypothetical protein